MNWIKPRRWQNFLVVNIPLRMWLPVGLLNTKTLSAPAKTIHVEETCIENGENLTDGGPNVKSVNMVRSSEPVAYEVIGEKTDLSVHAFKFEGVARRYAKSWGDRLVRPLYDHPPAGKADALVSMTKNACLAAEQRDKAERKVYALLALLCDRFSWLEKERRSGGDYEHLTTRISECDYILGKIRKDFSQ